MSLKETGKIIQPFSAEILTELPPIAQGILFKWLVFITIADTTSPNVVCTDTTVYLNASGSITIDTTYINNGSIDNCSIENMYLSKHSFGCNHIGDNEVWLYVVDESENIDSCRSTVTVKDTTSPSLVTNDITVYLDASGNSSITENSVVTNASDNCNLNDTILSRSDFTCIDIGNVAINVTVKDNSNNETTKQVNVKVEDNMKPTITCPVDQIVDADENNTYTVSGNGFNPLDTSDNCELTGITNDFNNSQTLDGASFSAGTRTVIWSVTDGSGNSAECSFNVKVNEYVGINDLSDKGISIYPNPTEGKLFIEIESIMKNGRIEVLDMMGSVILLKEKKKETQTASQFICRHSRVIRDQMKIKTGST